MKILFVASECAPLCKVGGLGDVVAALPKTLSRLGHDVRVVLPLYRAVDRAAHGVTLTGTSCVHMGQDLEHWVGIYETRLDGDVPVWLIDYAAYYDRPGIYDEPGVAYVDNAQRFALLCKAALQLCKDRAFIPHVIHLHDWPTALGAVLLKTWERILSPLSATASVLTIHNVAHQGKFDASAFPYFGVGDEHFHELAFEDHGDVNLLKAGICFADGLTTVSPTYREEILSPEGGLGLAPYLARRSDDFAGILNGVDYELWNPETDRLLPAQYGATDLTGKAQCKAQLQQHFGLAVRADLPLFGVVSRFVSQKGIDLMCGALPAALELMPIQVVALGQGERSYEDFFRWLGSTYPGRAGHHIGYSDPLSHLIEAGSDFFLMPSAFEPCGLNQLYSLKYGTLPLVRATGGLNDTVENYDERSGAGTGFKFHAPTTTALRNTIGWAVSTWFDRPHHVTQLRRQAMAQDFSWQRSAQAYLATYRAAMVRRQLWT